MAKHQLIISNGPYPVRSEAEPHKFIRTLVVNWKGTWEPRDRPEQCLVVAPGDEIEIVLSSERQQSGSLWIFNHGVPLLVPTEGLERQDTWERVDIESGSKVLQVNPSLAGASGESRYDLRTTALGKWPVPIVGQGDPGTLTASKP